MPENNIGLLKRHWLSFAGISDGEEINFYN
jgi:hypothetical protein